MERFYVLDNPSIRLAENVRTLFVGREAVLRCMVSGVPLPTVKWLMNGKELRNGDLNQTISLEKAKEEEQFNISLHISEVNIKHVGNFTCEARNKYHTTRRNVHVKLTCKGAFFKIIY